MKIPFLLLICLMLMPAAYAENLYYEGGQYGRVYKWADDYGNVHYTRHAPEYGSYSEIDQAPPASEGSQPAIEETGDTQTGDGWIADQAASGKLTAKEIINRNCVIARNNLTLLQNVRGKQLTYVNSEGKTANVDNAQRAARIKAAQDNIAHYCQ